MNVLDEYMLKLGASVDASGMARFQQALREATVATDATAVGMARSMLKAQTEIVSGFLAIGGAALGLVDKVAMADQEYRLFALHLYMSKDAARSLKVAMDALGQPLENLVWDPELQARTRQLIADQRAMAPTGDFEAQMRKIRDVRFEFTRMEVEMKYLGMHVVQDFMKALGLGPDTLLKRLQVFNDWVTKNMPAISQKMVTYFLPIWHDTLDVLRATGEAIKDAALLFTNLVGLFSGDSSIEGTALNFDKLLKSINHVSQGFAGFAMLVAHTEELLLHFVNALTLMADNKFKEAGAELKLAGSSISTKEGMELLGGGFGMVMGGPMGALAGAGAMHEFGGAMEHSAYHSMVEDQARAFGIDPAVLHALAMQESGESQVNGAGQTLTSSTGALGIMQLMPKTAAGLGVDPYDMDQNVRGGAYLFKQLLARYGDIPTAIAAYHEGQPKMDAVLAGRATLSSEARSEVAGVMRRTGATGDVRVGSITIHIDKPNTVNEDVANVVIRRLREEKAKETQRNMQEFTQPAWSY